MLNLCLSSLTKKYYFEKDRLFQILFLSQFRLSVYSIEIDLVNWHLMEKKFHHVISKFGDWWWQLERRLKKIYYKSMDSFERTQKYTEKISCGRLIRLIWPIWLIWLKNYEFWCYIDWIWDVLIKKNYFYCFFMIQLLIINIMIYNNII